MQRDKFTHRNHASDVELERERHTDHPVLEFYEVDVCPHDDCRYQELVDYEIDHDISLPFDPETRLDELTDEIELPVIHTYHMAGGHMEGKDAFQTHEEAEIYIFGRYNGTGNRSTTGNTIRKTYSLTHGTHSQVAREKDYPMICAIIDTVQDKPAYTNLVPRESDVPESAPHWQRSIEHRLDYHLNPPEHIIKSKLGEDDQYARVPDGYEHDALAWHVEQVAHWQFVIQTPEIILDSEQLETGLEIVNDRKEVIA